MKRRILIFGVSLVLVFFVVNSSLASIVKFDFAGNLGDGSQNGNTSFGTISSSTAFFGSIIYDTDRTGIQTGDVDTGWDRKEYQFESFTLTVGSETFSMLGNAPDDANVTPYGTISITDYPNTDQFFVKIYGKKNGGDMNNTFGGKQLKSIQMAFSGIDLLNNVGTDLMSATTLQDRFDASTRAVLTLVGTDDYTVSSSIKNGSASSVPIPGAAWLLGSGLLGMVGIRRRKQQRIAD